MIADWRRLLVLALLATLPLAGCGGGSDDDEPDRVGPPAPDCRAKPESCA